MLVPVWIVALVSVVRWCLYGSLAQQAEDREMAKMEASVDALEKRYASEVRASHDHATKSAVDSGLTTPSTQQEVHTPEPFKHTPDYQTQK